MRYQLLRRSGLRVSELCLGTMTFGEEWGWGSSKDESRAVFTAFTEAGGNFLDTADFYTNGTSEKLLGEFMGNDRDRFVLATKYTSSRRKGDPNGCGNHRKSFFEAPHASLKRLNTEYLDLYWLRQRHVIPIFGARRLWQFRDNLGCLSFTLPAEQVEKLDAASRIELGFPHDFLASEMIKEVMFGGTWGLIDRPGTV